MLKGRYKQMFSLEGKVAVVTGACGILGKEFCAGLADQGANLAIVDLDEESTSAFARHIADVFKVETLPVVCDVSSVDQVNYAIEKIVHRFGKIDILHNNAASKSNDLNQFFAKYEEYSLDEWQKIMSVNLDGMFLMSQACGKIMAEGTGGSIIQTSSIYGVVAPDQRIYTGSEYNGRPINTPAVYSVSKAGVVGLTKYLASYWADKSIRVNTLTPGGNQSGQNEEFVNKYSQRVPMRRMGAPHEMVGALLFLSSDASSYITGQNVIVDGGLSVW